MDEIESDFSNYSEVEAVSKWPTSLVEDYMRLKRDLEKALETIADHETRITALGG